MQKKKSSLGFIAFMWLVFPTLLFSARAQALTGAEIMEKVQEQSRIHKTQTFDVYMEIYDSKNRKRERFFTNRKKIKKKSSRSLVRFYQPADIKNTGLLSHKKDDSLQSDQWIYLPAFKSVKKLSNSDRHNSFMGSDFSNADIAGRSLEEDTHTLISQEDKAYYVTSIPVSSEDQYSKLEYKIHRTIWVPLEVTFYDTRGKLLKTLKNRKVRKVQGMYVVVDAEMENMQKGSKTKLSVSEVKVGEKFSDSLFTTKGLKL